MNYNLAPEQISEVKSSFSGWQEVQDRKSELKEEEKGFKERVASIIEGKVGDAGKLFKAMQQLYDGAEADVNDIASVLECIKANG